MDTEKIIKTIEAVCKDLILRKEELCELDAKSGDGDLGITMAYGSRAILELLHEEDLTPESLDAILNQCGEAFEESTGSTLSIILAEMFYSAAKSLNGITSPGTSDVTSMLEAIGQGVQNRGKVNVGDKTIFDAIKPSIDAFKKAQQSGEPSSRCLEDAVKAAEKGMEGTSGMTAKTGRASWMGEKVTENIDPGAYVWVCILKEIMNQLALESK